MEDILKHFGVKGMKWGVRKDKPSIRDHLSSLKRERQWKKVLKEIDNLTTNEITAVSKRVGLENELKRLSRKSPIAKQSDKNDYTFRDKLSDEELSRKVTRLKAKDSLNRTIKDASKEQREIGEKIVNAGGNLAMTYAKNKALTPKDIFDSVNNPKPIKDRAVQDIVNKLAKKPESS